MKLTLEQKCQRRTKVNATAANNLGPKITSVERVAQLADEKKSVFSCNTWGLLPAVVVMNMATSQVHRAVTSGSLFEYRKP